MSEANDTRPTVAAKAGDWVELRCGWIIGPLVDSEDGDDFPLVCMDSEEPSWSRSGKYLRGDTTHGLDIVAIVPRPTEPVKADDSPPDHDPVNHPSHYTSHPSGVECIEITRHMTFNVGNAVKYLWRADHKHDTPIQDLRKAVWYLQDEIRRIEAARKAGG